MIELVISGGQTGADQAGWRAAKACGLKTGGWMPKYFAAEDRNHPEFADLYGAKEHPSPDYPPRTTSNIGLADMTLLFGNPNSPGAKLAFRIGNEINHPVFPIRSRANPSPETTVRFIRRWTGIKSLNIAGNRESSAPGIGAWVEKYMLEVFRILREQS